MKASEQYFQEVLFIMLVLTLGPWIKPSNDGTALDAVQGGTCTWYKVALTIKSVCAGIETRMFQQYLTSSITDSSISSGASADSKP